MPLSNSNETTSTKKHAVAVKTEETLFSEHHTNDTTMKYKNRAFRANCKQKHTIDKN